MNERTGLVGAQKDDLGEKVGMDRVREGDDMVGDGWWSVGHGDDGGVGVAPCTHESVVFGRKWSFAHDPKVLNPANTFQGGRVT